MSDQSEAPAEAAGFLGRRHDKVRFTDLGETFFARLILLKCANPGSQEVVRVELSLSDLFRRLKPGELATALAGNTVASAPRHTELSADMLSALTGVTLRPRTTTSSTLDFYQEHIASRLRVLKRGAAIDEKQPCLEEFEIRTDGKLITALRNNS